MSYREKAAWIAFLATGVVYGWYFWKVMPILASGHAVVHYAFLLSVTVLAVSVLQGIPLIGFAIASPTDASAPQDEREQLYALKGTRTAYYVLTAGALFVSVEGIFLGANAAMLANLSLLAVVTASLAQHLTVIAYFRFTA